MKNLETFRLLSIINLAKNFIIYLCEQKKYIYIYV